MSRLALAIALLTSTTLAEGSYTLVNQKPPSAKTLTASVPVGSATIDPQEFATALLDCKNYPMTATYASVKALVACKTLSGPDSSGHSVIYQRSGGLWPLEERHWVIALRVVESTPDRARVEWDLVQHARGEDGAFTGPFAATLNQKPDAVYTPYNSGYWEFDRAKGTVTYSATSDPGGSVPSWAVSEGAATAFPKELLRKRYGVVVD